MNAFATYTDCWEKIALQMTQGKISRFDAYHAFHELHLQDKLAGMGPAYYTKLIFFLEPTHSGYIMDQWTARSMNLLRNEDASKIRLLPVFKGRPAGDAAHGLNYYVDPKRNSVNIYKAFCDDLEQLANELGIPASSTEVLLFSNGDKGKKKDRSRWREYVLEHG